MLIDDFLPEFDAVESHTTIVCAPVERVWAAIRTADFGSNGIVRALFALRGVPAFLSAPRESLARTRRTTPHEPLTLETALTHGFIVLDEKPGRELLLGAAGRFWGATGTLREIDAQHFSTFAEPGAAQAVWNFTVRPLVGERTMLTTETRVRCTDEESRWRFQLYWILIRPFSGAIRLLMLRAIKRQAEQPLELAATT
jgi:hypothetical protein